jgi:hypothetical protein
MSVRTLVKVTIGLVGPAAAIIGTLLGLNVIHPFGGGGNALAAAAGQVADAGTSLGTLKVQVLSNGKELRRVSGDGAFDFRKGQFRESFESRSSSVSGRAVLIFAPPLLYQHVLPARLQPLPGGKEWLAVDLGALQVAKGPSEFGILGFGENDPSQFLEYLRSSGSVKKIGQERLFGVVTTHYAADIDPAKVLPPTSAGKGGAPGASSGHRPHEEAWIDAGGLVRRIEIDFRLGALEFVETLDFENFGTAVDLTPPPVEQTADLTAVLRGRVPLSPVPALPAGTITGQVWVKRANAVCARTLGDEHRLTEPVDPTLLPGWIRSQIEVAERGIRGLAALPPPVGGGRQAAQLVRISAKEADYAKAFLLAVDFGTTKDVQRIQRQLLSMDADFNRIARELGAEVCAKS